MDKKDEYWNHFLGLRSYWGYGVTPKRLEKIKTIIWNDQDFWWDVLERHPGNKMTPAEMEGYSLQTYQHCFGNFAGMIYQTMVRQGILK